jgi:hypothetical protein
VNHASQSKSREDVVGFLEQKRLERMRKAVDLAESIAPTRPHPGVESATGNMLAGPFAAMLDRTRDALSSKGSD